VNIVARDKKETHNSLINLFYRNTKTLCDYKQQQTTFSLKLHFSSLNTEKLTPGKCNATKIKNNPTHG